MGKFLDLKGLRFGKWTVIKRDVDSTKKNIHWICECDCGTIRSVSGTSLKAGISVSCGCERDAKTSKRTLDRINDLSGKRFGAWTVLRRDSSRNCLSKRGARWICLCDCGTTKSVLGYSLRNGSSKSCGCKSSSNHIINLTGKRFGHLLVLQEDTNRPQDGRGAYWTCQCDCGNRFTINGLYLRNGSKTSCGCQPKTQEKKKEAILIGRHFGFWTVLEKDNSKRGKGLHYLCKCSCGAIRSVSEYALLTGASQSCGCKKTVPASSLVGKKFGKLLVVEQDLNQRGSGIHWLYKCDCGVFKSYRTNILLSGKVVSCGCENHAKSSKRLFQDLSGMRFSRLTVIKIDHVEKDKNGNSSYYWLCQCDCGNLTIVSANSLNAGFTQSCGCLQAEASASRAKERIINLTGQRFGLLTVIERVELNDSGTGLGKWRCLCECGNEKLVEGGHLRNGTVSSCGCLKQSKYELFVIQYFEKKGYLSGIDYTYQKRFDGLIGFGGRMLSYDFAFYKNDVLSYLIECQGKQHYEPVDIFGGEEQFAKQQLHDELKNDYARRINVPLIEIPYTVQSLKDVAQILSSYGL